MAAYTIRALAPADEPFLWEMLYHAIYVAEGVAPPDRAIIQKPELAKYVRGWGKPNDRGVIAIDTTTQQPVGAAWLRLLRGEDRGYGYIDDQTPELSIAILPSHRGKGLGTALLEELLEVAASYYPAISLSVDRGNPASRLYRRLGFEVIDSMGTSLIMKKRFR